MIFDIGEIEPSRLPPSVMAAISAAARVYDQLHESDRHLHFGTDPQTGRLSAHLQDLEGNHLAPVTPRQVLAIASGQSAHAWLVRAVPQSSR